ncbi:MAG: hypothetical protein ACLTSX_12415 [Collinsella sp.]
MMAFTRGGGLRIEAEGLEETIRALKSINKDILREFRRGLKEDAKPILTEARNNAQAIARTGAYASSMALRTLANGVKDRKRRPRRGNYRVRQRRGRLPLGASQGPPGGRAKRQPAPRARQGGARQRERRCGRCRDPHRADHKEVPQWVRQASQ